MSPTSPDPVLPTTTPVPTTSQGTYVPLLQLQSTHSVLYCLSLTSGIADTAPLVCPPLTNNVGQVSLNDHTEVDEEVEEDKGKCVCVCVCVCVRVYVRACVHACMCVSLCIHILYCMCIYVHPQVCMCI